MDKKTPTGCPVLGYGAISFPVVQIVIAMKKDLAKKQRTAIQMGRKFSGALGFVVLALSFLAGQAHAACTTGDGVNYDCSGVTSSHQVIPGGDPRNITIDASYTGSPSSVWMSQSAPNTHWAIKSAGNVTATGLSTDTGKNVALTVLEQGGGGGIGTIEQTAGVLTGTDLGAGILVSSTRGGDVTISQSASAAIRAGGNGIVVVSPTTATITLEGSIQTDKDNDAVPAPFYYTGPFSFYQTGRSGVSSTALNLALEQKAGSSISSRWGIMAQGQNQAISIDAGASVEGRVGEGVQVSLISQDLLKPSIANITSAGTITGGNESYGISVFSSSGTQPMTVNIDQTAGQISGGYAGIYQEDIGLTNTTTTINVSGEVRAQNTDTHDEVWQTYSNEYDASTDTYTITTTKNTATVPGAAIATNNSPNSHVVLNLNEGAVVSSASGMAIRDRLGQSNVTLNSGSKVIGQITLGEGNDALAVKGTANISEVTLLDGGSSVFSTTQSKKVSTENDTTGEYSTITTPDRPVTPDMLGTAGAATNKLTFEGTTQSLAGSIIKNWQTVTVDGSTLTFQGDAALVTGTGTNADGSLQGLVLTNSGNVISPLPLAVVGDVAIGANSMLKHAAGGSVTGNVSNAGVMDWSAPGQRLTIAGNYTGAAGSVLSLETYLGDDSSVSDTLHVTGNTSGTTQITLRPTVGSPGAQTINGIPLIQVDAMSDAVFVLAGGQVVAGSYIYTLKKIGTNWYLQSTRQADTTAPTGTVNSATTADTTPPITGTVDDPTATVQVSINGASYPATNNGNGTWTLPDNVVAALTPGVTYPVTATFTDAAGNSSTAKGSIAIIGGPYEVDPPAITKLGTLSNLVTHEVTWSIKVTNDGANNVSLPALPVEITDPVPNQSQFVSGSITCVASNGAVVISQCVFDNPSSPTTVLVKAELPYGTSVTVKVKSLTADNVPSVLNTAFVNYTDKGQAASANAMSNVPLKPVEKIPALSPLALLMLAWLIAGGAFWQLRYRFKT